MGNYHQKRVRVNYHYFVVMENGKIPYMCTPTPRPAYAVKKITKADLAKTLRYKRRDKSVSVKKS